MPTTPELRAREVDAAFLAVKTRIKSDEVAALLKPWQRPLIQGIPDNVIASLVETAVDAIDKVREEQPLPLNFAGPSK